VQPRAPTPRLLVEAARQSYISSYHSAFMPKLYYRIILIVLTVACGMGAVVTTPFAMFAAMAFDAPGSEHQLGAWVVFFVVLSIPLWFVVGAITGWFLYLRNWLRASALIAATPIAATTIGWLLLQLA
jgi:hypothetical protein